MSATPENDFVFTPLGGVGEIGMNLALYGYGPPKARKWIMVDCGLGFPGADLPGVEPLDDSKPKPANPAPATAAGSLGVVKEVTGDNYNYRIEAEILDDGSMA